MPRTSWAVFAGIAFIGLTAGCQEKQGGKLYTQPSESSTTTSTTPEVNDRPITAAEREEAVLRLERAIQALGGGAAISKVRALEIAADGLMDGNNVKQKLSFQFPDRLHLAVEFPEQSKTIILALNGSDGWQFNGVQSGDMIPEFRDDIQTELNLQRDMLLLSLKDPEVQLRPLPEQQVNSRRALGIQARRPNRPTVSFYFDAETNLLVMVRIDQFREAGVLQSRELMLLNHLPVDGLKLPSQIIDRRGGRVFMEWKTVKYRVLDALDAKLFERSKG